MAWYRSFLGSKFLTPAIILIGGALVSVALFLSAPEPEKREAKSPVILVDAFRITKAPLTMTVQSQGEVLARTRTTLVSEVSGVVLQLNEIFVAGGVFTAGEVLIVIDDRHYIADLERAKANVASARTRLAEEKGLAEYAIFDWKNSRMAKKGEPSALARREPQILEAKAKLDSALAELKRKRGDLERTRVVAVYDGMVEERKVDVGQYVTPGTPLGVVFSTDIAEVRLPIPLHDLDFLNLPDGIRNKDHRVPVELSAIGRDQVYRWFGEIVRTEAVMDRKNRVLYAIAEVKDPYTGFRSPLRIGSYVNAVISGRQFDNIARIPRAAVRPGNKIWIVNKKSQLEMRLINPVRADERFLYVDSGVVNDEIISITPLENPLPGTEVRFQLTGGLQLSTSDGRD
ncbi:MAG: efflux RND transporter periplasmic adaptor subunit [Gammaproteobacteria bacterium]|nr:efflux RND transporter periplasmic adaptor subunit [Gammaproteobacteria bacterium]